MNLRDDPTLDQKSWSFLNLIGQTPLTFTMTNIVLTGNVMVGGSTESTFAGQVAMLSLRLTAGASKIIPGSTSLLFRRSDDSTSNLAIADDGTMTFPGTIRTTSGGGYLSSDTSPGISTSITSANLVGKTITFKDGLITNFS